MVTEMRILGLPMPKPSAKPTTPKRRGKKSQDANEWAFDVVNQAIAKSEQTETLDPERETVDPSVVSQVMAQMGRKGGKKGGKARMAMLTPAQRSRLGTKAVNARWEAKRKAG